MNAQRGFSLIELIIVMILMSIVAGISGVMLTAGFKSYTQGKPIIPVAGKANVALTNLMREIQDAQTITAATATSMTIINQSGQTISFNWSNTTLTRTVSPEPAQSLCTNVSAFSFAYFDSSFATAVTLADIRFITAAFTLTEGPVVYPLMTGAVMRQRL